MPTLGPPQQSGRCRMMCTKCDFQCEAFDGWKWKPGTEYVFLRNYFPNFSKLKDQLDKDPAFAAYACQCQHTSISESKLITMSDPLSCWRCRGH
eukprot:NODE_4206_length_827_cov_8.775064_g3478_i0.p2 GENE.NODE_4206_length_827_cov_8.775064_g3478_i0~~NODE_4206_length_827_cov_8.775064_g3478_i0.p2  ORF type:complete len:94 (+),score=2.70 NODE_4206_length_827_cov_8.775064_g3478_i0:511-792(+)